MKLINNLVKRASAHLASEGWPLQTATTRVPNSKLQTRIAQIVTDNKQTFGQPWWGERPREPVGPLIFDHALVGRARRSARAAIGRPQGPPTNLAERLECGGLPPLWEETNFRDSCNSSLRDVISRPACEDARPTSPLHFELPICNLVAASCRPVAALYERRGSPRRSQTAATEN